MIDESPPPLPASIESLPPLMLRLNILHAGDVILSHGLGKIPAVIAHLSAGEFSHAALCTAPNIVFESDGGLVGSKVLENLGWSKTIFGEAQLGRLPDIAKQCAVYRHPEIHTVTPDRFANALEKEMLESFGKHYSEMFRLVRLATMNDSAKRMLESFLKLKHRWFLKDNIPGPFCSELVGRFYQRLDLPLFPDGKSPANISPNDLTHSFLVKVNDAVLTRDQISDPPTQLPGIEEFDRKANKVSVAITADMNAERQWAKVLDDAKKDAPVEKVDPASVLEMVTGSFARLISDISDRLELWHQIEDPADCRRTQRVERLAFGLISQWPEIMSSEGDEFDKYTNASRALGILRRSFLRTVVLHEIGRLKVRKRSEGFWARRKTNEQRRRLVNSCRFSTHISIAFEKEWRETQKVGARILRIGEALVEGLPSS